MSERSFEPDPLDELREIAAAAEKLAGDAEAFVEAFDAHAASDAARFQAALDRVGLVDRCDLICVYFCEKRCVGTCASLCPELLRTKIVGYPLMPYRCASVSFWSFSAGGWGVRWG